MANLPSFLDVLSRNLFILEKCEEPMKEGQVRRQLENKLSGVQGVGSTLELFAALKEGHEDKTSSRPQGKGGGAPGEGGGEAQGCRRTETAAR